MHHHDTIATGNSHDALEALNHPPLPQGALEALTARGNRQDDPRPLRILTLLAEGKTQAEAAATLNISRQTVSLHMRGTYPHVLAALAERNTAKVNRERKKALQGWSRTHVGVPLDGIAHRMSMTAAAAARLLGDDAVLHPPRVRNPHVLGSGVPTEEVLEGLRQFHASTGSTARSAYAAWALEHGALGPQGVILRFGKWSEALVAAGVIATATELRLPHRQFHRLVDHDGAVRVMAQALVAVGYPGSATRIEAWLRGRPDLPSLGTLRKEGTFAGLRGEAIEFIAAQMGR